MPWQRMMFRSDPVWVLVGDDGRLALDRDGRAEMKYRPTDEKSYRPGPANLSPHPSPETIEGGGAGTGAGAAAPRARQSAAGAGSAAASKRAAAAASGTDGALQIWTDGACSGNPGPMGIGV